MLQLEAQVGGIERNGAGDIFYLVSDAVNTLDEGMALDVT
jgi:hypothetical protein